MFPQPMFLAKIRKIFKKNHLKMNIFTAVKYCCILHGRVCVMELINNLISTYYFVPILPSHFFRVLCPVVSGFYVLFPESMLKDRPV